MDASVANVWTACNAGTGFGAGSGSVFDLVRILVEEGGREDETDGEIFVGETEFDSVGIEEFDREVEAEADSTSETEMEED